MLPKPNEHATTINDEHFVCSICGETAGVVALIHTGTRFEIHRTGITGQLQMPVESKDVERISGAIARSDARALYAFDFEITPFYCPDCDAIYCRAHWQTADEFEDGFHDCIRGICPKGHERMLED